MAQLGVWGRREAEGSLGRYGFAVGNSKVVPKEPVSQATEITVSQKKLATKGTELSQLSAKHVNLTVEVRRVELQSAAGDIVSNDSNSVAKACERLLKRASMTRRYKAFFATPSKTAF